MDIRLKRYKKDFDHSYTFGVFPTLELLTHQPGQAIKVLIHPKGVSNQGITKIQTLCQKKNILTEFQERTFERLGARPNDYAVGVFKKTNLQIDALNNHVVLVNPSSMGNLGTIMRTMLGFGYQDLAIIEPAVDQFDPKVVRAAMGSIFKLRVSTYPNFQSYKDGYSRDYYALMTDSVASIATLKYRTPYSLIFGNESSGLGEEYYSLGTGIRIPQTEAIDSFNLAIAVGITLYQFSLAQDR
jgi:RNA methyltransferase, TrmH family